jgi:glutathione S-transferase
MIELYHCVDARSFRCLWLLEEMQLPYKLHQLPFPPSFKSPEYLELNPLGTVPLLLDGDARLFESIAILQYLTDHYGPSALAVSPQEPAYASFLNWLHLGESSLATHLSVMLRYAIFEPEARRLPQVVKQYQQLTMQRLDLLDQRLDGREYVSADRFTIADISLGYSLILCRLMNLSDQLPKNVRAYWDRLRSRPAFGAARAAQKAPQADAR